MFKKIGLIITIGIKETKIILTSLIRPFKSTSINSHLFLIHKI